MSVVYSCEFEFRGIEQEASSGALEDFTRGFWITGDLRFTKGEDARYWIPPGKIVCVTKIKPER